MFCVFSTRVIKQSVANSGQDKADRYRPRTENVRTIHGAGPFISRRTAERAALAAMSTHTCVAAIVYDRPALQAIIDKREGSYEAQKLAKEMLALMPAS